MFVLCLKEDVRLNAGKLAVALKRTITGNGGATAHDETCMTHSKLDSQGLIAALCATAMWGMSGVFVRWLPVGSPFVILAGRFLVAVAVMLPVLLLTPSLRVNLTQSLSTPQIWWLSLPAIGSYVLGTIAFQMAPVGEVTLLFTTSPLFVTAYKYITRTPIQRTEATGIFLAAVGVSLIMLPQLSLAEAVSWQIIIGYFLALGVAGFIALYAGWLNTLAQQGTAPKSLHIVFVTFVLGSILSILCSVFFRSSVQISSPIILLFLGLGILSTALPFLCYTVAVQRLPVMLTTAILLLEPMFAVLFASVAFQETPSLWFGLGSILVLGGLFPIAREAAG